LIRLEWVAIDAWFEEDEELFTHPRDPHTRVDILPSSRHVEVHGVTIAESGSPKLLFETGLSVRYYLPKTHVRMDLLTPTDTVTHCPYKGQAEPWSVRAGDTLHEGLAWSYRTPLPESEKVTGLIPSTTTSSISTWTVCFRSRGHSRSRGHRIRAWRKPPASKAGRFPEGRNFACPPDEAAVRAKRRYRFASRVCRCLVALTARQISAGSR
jgi:uncharacterized protein (DUF427 family)